MSMNDREKALENKYANDQQKLFRIEARASKLVGLWAAEQMSLTGEAAEAYAKDVIAANLDEPGYDDIKRKIFKDFDDKDIEVSDHMFDAVLEKKIDEAARQIENDGK